MIIRVLQIEYFMGSNGTYTTDYGPVILVHDREPVDYNIYPHSGICVPYPFNTDDYEIFGVYSVNENPMCSWTCPGCLHNHWEFASEFEVNNQGGLEAVCPTCGTRWPLENMRIE